MAVRGLQRKANKAAKQMAYANIVALTRTAWDGKRVADKHLQKDLHNPTPFTKRANRVERATKRKRYSRVYIAPVQAKYLSQQVYGGNVSKRVPVPPREAKNQYGNLPRKATKRRRTYNVKTGGKSYTFQRTSKKKSKLLGTWTDSRVYGQRLEFHDPIRREVKKRYKGHLKREFKKAMRTAR